MRHRLSWDLAVATKVPTLLSTPSKEDKLVSLCVIEVTALVTKPIMSSRSLFSWSALPVLEFSEVLLELGDEPVAPVVVVVVLAVALLVLLLLFPLAPLFFLFHAIISSRSTARRMEAILKLGWTKQRAAEIIEAVRGPETPTGVTNSVMLGVIRKGTGRLLSSLPLTSSTSNLK